MAQCEPIRYPAARHAALLWQSRILVARYILHTASKMGHQTPVQHAERTPSLHVLVVTWTARCHLSQIPLKVKFAAKGIRA